MNNAPLSRREMLVTAGTVAAGVALAPARSTQAAPQAKVLDTSVISKLPTKYHGWPTLARRRNGQLLLVCSGGRETHVCPFGRVDYMTSNDGGATWTFPRVLLDGPIDDRDAGVVETAKGSILVTTFTSLAYEPILKKAEANPSAWSAAKLANWQAAHTRISADQRKKELGTWMIRSTDGGVTFSARYDCLVNSPHGPVQLSDGRVLYAGKELWRETSRIGVCESKDDGESWRWLAEIPTRKGDDHTKYHELHAVEAADGRLIAHIRNHNKAHAGETLQSVSTDGGESWSELKSIGVWGLPSHLLRLRDGRLLMSYGHRRAPLGNLARVSEDHGQSWLEPLTISGDGTSGDLGYPSTVELDDGSLVSVWYERMRSSPQAVLRQARWQLG